MVIPDSHVKPGVPLEHMTWAGNYAAAKRPDVILHLGDFTDMSSLSSYDKGKKAFEGRRYKDDIAVCHKALKLFNAPIQAVNRRAKKAVYEPEMHMLLGNHEDRIDRAVNLQPELEGVISVDDLQYEEHGWTVHPFLEVLIINGVAFSHYFTTGIMGRPATSPSALTAKKHMSCVMGHVQREGIHTEYRADGKRITGIFAGTYYQHDEDYLGPQGNSFWRGVWMLHSVEDGDFDVMPVSLRYLKEKYS
jgi:predicted phosphodiesterase